MHFGLQQLFSDILNHDYILTHLCNKLKWGTFQFSLVSFHGLMIKSIGWQYMKNLRSCLCLRRKVKDISQIIASFWESNNHDNRFRFQTKDDVIARPDGIERNRFQQKKTTNLNWPLCVCLVVPCIQTVCKVNHSPLHHAYIYRETY